MTEVEKIITLVLEAEDDETIKDILGPDYHEPVEPDVQGEVFRHDRWAAVKIGDRNYCVSYLTPVAVYTPRDGVIRTSKNWSTSTIRHIKKWLQHITMLSADDPSNWLQIQMRFPNTMPQDELVSQFKKDAGRVAWGKREAQTLASVPYDRLTNGLKSDRDERVELEPGRARKEWEE